MTTQAAAQPADSRAAGQNATENAAVPAESVPEPPRPPVAALTGLTLLAGIGGWLVAAPFLLGDQVRAAAWTTPTRIDVATGGVLTVLALTGLLGYLGAAISWTARYGRG